MIRTAFAFGALVTTSIASTACHASYPDALRDCAKVTVEPANPGESGCSITFDGCPENGSAQMICDGSSTCTCTWSSDFARDNGSNASSTNAKNACTQSGDVVKTEALEICGAGSAG